MLRPRQVRAGVPRPLDALCDEVLNPHGAGGADADLDTAARRSPTPSREFVGDPTGMAAAEAAAGRRSGIAPSRRTPGSAAAGARTGPAGRAGAEPEPPEPEPEPGRRAASPSRGPADARAGGPTRAAHPGRAADLRRRRPTTSPGSPPATEPPPPPPPFEEPPERPLFAPEPGRRRPGPPARGPAPRAGAGAGVLALGRQHRHRPRVSTGSGVDRRVPDDEDEDDGVPGRSWLRLAACVGAGLLLLVAVVVAFNLGRGRTPLGDVPEDDQTATTPPTQPPTVGRRRSTGLTAADFDPQGDPPEENPELAPAGRRRRPGDLLAHLDLPSRTSARAGSRPASAWSSTSATRSEVSAVDLTLVGAPDRRQRSTVTDERARPASPA